VAVWGRRAGPLHGLAAPRAAPGEPTKQVRIKSCTDFSFFSDSNVFLLCLESPLCARLSSAKSRLRSDMALRPQASRKTINPGDAQHYRISGCRSQASCANPRKAPASADYWERGEQQQLSKDSSDFRFYAFPARKRASDMVSRNLIWSLRQLQKFSREWPQQAAHSQRANAAIAKLEIAALMQKR
jgi:hypothetical protein